LGKYKAINKSENNSGPKQFLQNQSDPKKRILYYIKIMQQAGLEDISRAMNISRMGAHKHLANLQKRGLVESIEVRKGVGRPRMQYQLAASSKNVFPKSYSSIATHALDFIEKKMGKEAVEQLLRERQEELFDKYYPRLRNLKFDDKVKELAKIRDEEGYIAESRKNGKGSIHTILEYNCPIINIAENHFEACTAETELFEKILDAKVETTHTASKGDQLCKFLIRQSKEGF
jgi:predicted ArsR family transcriptional regulator